MATRSRGDRSDNASSALRENSENGGGNAGRGWHGDPEGHADAGRKGGQTVSRNREHMAAIGRKGGQAVSKDRQHMAAIGRKGGQARSDREENEDSDTGSNR